MRKFTLLYKLIYLYMILNLIYIGCINIYFIFFKTKKENKNKQTIDNC